MRQKGSALIFLLLGMLVMAGLYLSQGNALNLGRSPTGAVNPIDKSRQVVCKTNIMAIQTALPMYNMNHEPMKVLDIKQLQGIVSIQTGVGSGSCHYRFDKQGQVECETHGK